VADPRAGASGRVPSPPLKAPRYKKYLRICEDLDGGFVGENQDDDPGNKNR